MTGSAADLRDLESATVAYALRIEGCPTCFVTSPHLADGTWLTEHPTVLEALHFPKFSHGINPRTGAFTTANVSFEIEDLDDSVATLFASVRSDVTELESTLEPGDVAPAALFSKHVGVEAIGSAGARMQYPAVPNYSVGYKHIGNLQASSEYQPIAPVSDSPFVWAGRRVALLRVFHNTPTAGSDMSGVNWTAPANSDIVWVGTLLDEGSVKGKTWSLSAVGVQSWLTRPIGQDTWTSGVVISDSSAGFNDGEDRVGVYFAGLGINYAPAFAYGEDQWTTFASASLADIRTGVAASIAAALADAGPDGTWASDDGVCSFNDVTNRFTVQWKNPDFNVNVRCGIACVVMHQTAWSRLGYNPPVQTALDPADPKFVWFVSCDEIDVPFPSGTVEAPAGGYWMAWLVTVDGDWVPHGQFPDQQFQSRVYRPDFDGGTVVLSKKTPFTIDLGHVNGEPFLYLDGQHDAPVAGDPDDPSTPYTIDLS